MMAPGESDDDPYDFPLLASSEVNDSNRISVPEWVPSLIGKSIPEQNRYRIHWGYEVHSEFVVISKHSLRKENFEHVTDSKLQVSNVDSGTYRYLTIPKEIRDHMYKFVPGTDIVIYMREEFNDENPSAYLLTLSEIASLLPTGVTEDEDDLVKALGNNPGFFS